jgi:hypothetical protein
MDTSPDPLNAAMRQVLKTAQAHGLQHDLRVLAARLLGGRAGPGRQ